MYRLYTEGCLPFPFAYLVLSLFHNFSVFFVILYPSQDIFYPPSAPVHGSPFPTYFPLSTSCSVSSSFLSSIFYSISAIHSPLPLLLLTFPQPCCCPLPPLHLYCPRFLPNPYCIPPAAPMSPLGV
jgi:hypothetical protein